MFKINLAQGLFKVKHLYGKTQSINWIKAKHNPMYLTGGKILWQKKQQKKKQQKKKEVMKM